MHRDELVRRNNNNNNNKLHNAFNGYTDTEYNNHLSSCSPPSPLEFRLLDHLVELELVGRLLQHVRGQRQAQDLIVYRPSLRYVIVRLSFFPLFVQHLEFLVLVLGFLFLRFARLAVRHDRLPAGRRQGFQQLLRRCRRRGRRRGPFYRFRGYLYRCCGFGCLVNARRLLGILGGIDLGFGDEDTLLVGESLVVGAAVTGHATLEDLLAFGAILSADVLHDLLNLGAPYGGVVEAVIHLRFRLRALRVICFFLSLCAFVIFFFVRVFFFVGSNLWCILEDKAFKHCDTRFAKSYAF